jgi:DNA-binding HxlR family transcriptional regulator
MTENNIKISQKTCSIKEVLDIIGGKWAMPIIYHLSKGKMRFFWGLIRVLLVIV